MSATPIPQINGTGPLIMVADDSRAIRMLSVRTLTQGGFSTIEAENGAMALDMLRALGAKSQPVLVLMDINMPHMDGISCLHHIRHDDDLKGTPVLMASTESERSIVMQCAALGIAGYIIKPFTTEKLLGEVRRLVHDTENSRHMTEEEVMHTSTHEGAAVAAGSKDAYQQIIDIMASAMASAGSRCSSSAQCPVMIAMREEVQRIFPNQG